MLAGYGAYSRAAPSRSALIRLPDYCHVLVCGGTGSGKGVSIIIPNLLTYHRGSVVCFDTKGDLFETTARRRAASGQRIIRLAPFNGGTDAFNPLDTIPSDSPGLVDSARAMAEALVVRQGTEPDSYWNDKSVQVICAVLVLVLLRFKGEDRNLSSVQEIISDPEMLKAAAKMLQELGGIPARLGNQLKTLFDKDGSGLTKEGAGKVESTVASPLVLPGFRPGSEARLQAVHSIRPNCESLASHCSCRYRRTNWKRRKACSVAGFPRWCGLSALSAVSGMARPYSSWTRRRALGSLPAN